jgi:hypothetical protein
MTESAGEVPGRIFVSYRRDDTSYPAAWLFDGLAQHFGRDQVFKDVESIEPGDDFVEVITNAVASCDVLLALIGRQWLTDQDGQRRLDNPGDWVRLEIEAALTRNVRVIPILIEAALMPRADELPASLASLARRQALELSDNRFNLDIQRLLGVLDKTLAEAHEHRQREAGRAAQSQPQVEQPAEADSAPPGISSAATPGGIASGQVQANLGDVQATADEINQDVAWTDTRASLSRPTTAEKFRAVVQGFDSGDVDVRNKTASKVRTIAESLDLEDVLGFCRSRKMAERVGGAIALGVHLGSSKETRGDRRVLSALGKLLTDGRSRVRYRAAEALQSLPALVPTYKDQLRRLSETDENSWVKRAAAEALQAAHE